MAEVTPLVQGPTDTSDVYTGALFTSAQLQKNLMESTGPVVSFTLQLPHVALTSEVTRATPGTVSCCVD